MNRPTLNAVPLPKQWPPENGVYITIDLDSWDERSAAAYKCGVTILEVTELDGEERIVRAWQKPTGITP